jgi:hypothetical protein
MVARPRRASGVHHSVRRAAPGTELLKQRGQTGRGCFGARCPPVGPALQHLSVALPMLDRVLAQRGAPPDAPVGVDGQVGQQQPREVVVVVVGQVGGLPDEDLVQHRAQDEVHRGEAFTPVVGDEQVLQRLPGRLPRLVPLPDAPLVVADRRVGRVGELARAVGDHRHPAQQVPGAEHGTVGDVGRRSHVREVRGAHLQRVHREAGRGEQGTQVPQPGFGQRRVMPGRAVFVQDPLDDGLLLVLHGDVLAVGELVRIPEPIPVVGVQRRAVAVRQVPHVDRGGGIRLQR